MQLLLRTAALFLALAVYRAVAAQTLHNPARPYADLPVSQPPGEAMSDEALTIVPPAQSPATSPHMDGALAPAQHWTPDGVVYPRADVPMSHAIAAEPWDGGWFAAVELTIFRPVFDDILVIDREGSVGPRLVFGWESDRGFGLRTRFWGLETESLIAIPGENIDVRDEMFRFDFDMYREFDFKSSSVAVGASITAAESQSTDSVVGVGTESGAGIGVFLEGRHAICKNFDSQWSVLARGRWAGLVGEWEHPTNPVASSSDSSMRIVEASLGWEYKRNFDTCSFVLQHMIEVQTWDNYYVPDLTLFGQNVSFGFTF